MNTAANIIWNESIIFPTVEAMPYVNTITHTMIHRATEGDYQFLLGAAIANYRGTFYTSWCNSKVDENDNASAMRGRTSADRGVSWSNVKSIAPGYVGNGFHSHGVFFNHNDKLWAFTAQHGLDQSGEIYPGLKTEAFLLNEKTQQWETQGILAELFWPLEEPQKMSDGNWIMGGAKVDDKCYPAIAIISDKDVTEWNVVQIEVLSDAEKIWGETSVIVDSKEMLAIIRNGYGAKDVALVSTSVDFGKTWTPAKESNYPMANSKPYAGMLSTGQRYLISNWPDRNTLTIAVSEPKNNLLSKVWKIRHGASQLPRTEGRAKRSQWAYPYAIEFEKQLYVVYAVSKEDCELSIIPLEALR